jgi:hypothetical protein
MKPKTGTRPELLTGTVVSWAVTNPVAALRLKQTFAAPVSSGETSVEVHFRFSVPWVRVRCGAVEVRSNLKDSSDADAEYDAANDAGRQAAPDPRVAGVFTLSVTGVTAGEPVIVTDYIQVARVE